MDLYFDHKLNASARKILIAIEDYLRMNPDKSFADAIKNLKISNDRLGNDSQILNRIGSGSYGMLVTRQ